MTTYSVRAPNGRTYRIDGPPGASDEQVRAKILEQHPDAGNAAPRANPVLNAAGTILDIATSAVNPLSGQNAYARAARRGITAGLVNPLQSGVSAALSALRGGDFKGSYTRNQAAAHARDIQDRTDHPILSSVGEFAGAAAMPLGRAEMAGGAILSRVSPKLATTAARIANSTVGTGVRMGARGGAISAAGNTLDRGDYGSVLNNAVEGAKSGGLAGGILGGGIAAGSHVVRAIADRNPANAANVAYSKIADMLGRAHSEDAAGYARGPTYTPESARAAMIKARAAGSDPMLMDLSPEMQTAAGFLSRKPGLPGANELVAAGEDRAANAIGRFNARIERHLTPPTGNDALSGIAANTAVRKAAATDFHVKGGSMDTPLTMTPELEKFITDTPDVNRLMPRAITNAMRHDDAIAGPAIMGANGTVESIPSMRVFDYLKREFDGEIGKAVRAGDTTEASGLSSRLQKLKNIISEANPEYKDFLAAQRDMFQKNTAMEQGQNFLKQMSSPTGPRELLADLTRPEANLNEIKTGIVDALMHQNTPNPVAKWRAMTRRPDQQQVMQVLFGGSKQLNLFDKFIRRELRSNASDNWTRQGRQSGTQGLLAAGADIDNGGVAGRIAIAGAQGGAFGGVLGFAGNTLRKVDQIRRGMGPEAQDILAKALMGDARELPKAIKAARAVEAARKARTRSAGAYAGKVAGAVIGGKAQE